MPYKITMGKIQHVVKTYHLLSKYCAGTNINFIKNKASCKEAHLRADTPSLSIV